MVISLRSGGAASYDSELKLHRYNCPWIYLTELSPIGFAIFFREICKGKKINQL